MYFTIEDLSHLEARKRTCATQLTTEAYRGSDMVEWWGSIARAIDQKMAQLSTKEGKEAEIAVLSTFKKTWQDNPLTGSVSRSTLRLLATAANLAAANDTLECANFLLLIRDQLNKAIASQEELPTIPSSTGAPAGGTSHKAMPTGNFGAQKKAPGPSGLTPPETEKPADTKPAAA